MCVYFAFQKAPIMEETKKNTYYKYCIVAMCPNTTFQAPNKLFIRVPEDKNRRIRWFKACRRNVKDISEKNTALHVCEDHFNLEEDMDNYIKFKLMGGLKKMKPNVVPHIFDCQPDRKRSLIHASRAVAVKKAKRRIVDEAIASSSMIQDQSLNQNNLQIDVTSSQYLKNSTRSSKKMDSAKSGPLSLLADAFPKKNVIIQAYPTVGSKTVQCKLHCGVTVGLSPVKVYPTVIETVSELTNFIKNMSESTPSKNSSDENYSRSGSISDFSLTLGETKEPDKEKKEQFKKISLNGTIEDLHAKTRSPEAMDKFFTSMGVNPVPEVKPEPETEIYEIESLPHFTPLYNAPEPEIVKKNIPFREESVVHLENLKVIEKDGQHILKECLNYSMGNTENKMGLSEILPKCEYIVLNQKGPVVKIENNEVTNGSEQMYDLNFEERKIKNEDIHIKEECLEPHKTRCEDIARNQQEPLVKIENSEVINGSEKMYDLNFEERKIKNEDIYIKEECLEPHETSTSPYYCGQEKHEVYSTIQCYQNDFQHIKPLKGKMFRSHRCEFQTADKNGLKQDFLRQQNTKKINMFQCYQCDYQAKRKDHLKRHLLRHKKPKEVMFKCSQCDYQTIRKRNITRHLHRHKNPEDVKMFQCDQCDYQAIRKDSLQRHLLQHKNPEEINMFQCDLCNYQTIINKNLKQHLLRHKKPEGVEMLKCDLCNYRTIQKNNLKRHLRRHINPEKVEMFKCDQCDYQAKRKSHLKQHHLRHKNPEEVNMFKCDQCDYQAMRKDNLKQHLLRHKNPEEVNRFKCDQCDYQAIRKDSLERHLLRHKNPEEVTMYKCDQCQYKTVDRVYIKKHIHRHK